MGFTAALGNGGQPRNLKALPEVKGWKWVDLRYAAARFLPFFTLSRLSCRAATRSMTLPLAALGRRKHETEFKARWVPLGTSSPS